MIRKRTLGHLWLLCISVCLPGIAAGQEAEPITAGRIVGRVMDLEYGQPIALAHILVRDQNWGTMSLDDGTFKIGGLPPGRYALIVEMMGYRRHLEPGVDVVASGDTRLEIGLVSEIVGVTEVIVVRPEAGKLDGTKAEVVQEIGEPELEDMLPDDPTELIAQQTGIILHRGELIAHGARPGDVMRMIDGVPVRNPTGGVALSLASQSLSSARTILGAMGANIGNAQAGVIMYDTKEGSDVFQGELRYTTDDYGSPSNTYDNYDRIFASVGGPTSVTNLTYYLSAELTFADDHPKTAERRTRNRILNFISLHDRKTNSSRLQGKLAFRPSVNTKMTYEVVHQDSRRDEYHHAWSREGYVQTFLDTTRTGQVVLRNGRWSQTALDSTYRYYNAAEHTPNTRDQFDIHKLVIRNTLGDDSFWSARFSRQHFLDDRRVRGKQAWEYEGDREQDYWFNYSDGSSYDYFVISGDYPYLGTRESVVYTGAFDLTYLRGAHQLETGASLQYNDMRVREIWRPYLTDTEGAIGQPNTNYHYYNPEGSLYLQDHWKFEDMTVQAGLRYDFFSVGEQVSNSDVRSRIKHQISPRVGMVYPISDRDVFSFFYGRYYQVPSRQYLYDNLDSYDDARGNPNLTNETTISYQAAILHSFSKILTSQFSIYYRDIYGLIAAEATPDWTSTGDIWTFENKDYASAKGFEVSLARSYHQSHWWRLAYTCGVATGVASDPSAALSQDLIYLPTGEIPLNWDIRHSIGASVYVGDRTTWGMSLSWSYSSGAPYTPLERDTRETEPEKENSRRLPSTSALDLRADKHYELWGRRFSLFVQGRNILDARNITYLTPSNRPDPPSHVDYRVYYTETGRAGGAYLRDLDGDGLEEFVPLADPRVFGAPRTVRIGVSYRI